MAAAARSRGLGVLLESFRVKVRPFDRKLTLSEPFLTIGLMPRAEPRLRNTRLRSYQLAPQNFLSKNPIHAHDQS
ncbi:MAG: hypothetical protein QOH71_4022 [Blastocatellia bacterium]|jgi:hypothetical protein|nr:hypothetical protein [Blastocatellia bacterium]